MKKKYDHMHLPENSAVEEEEVGQQLSKKLGNSFLRQKRILARVAEESDMSEEFVKNHERMQSTATLSMSRSDTDFQALTQKRS